MSPQQTTTDINPTNPTYFCWNYIKQSSQAIIVIISTIFVFLMLGYIIFKLQHTIRHRLINKYDILLYSVMACWAIVYIVRNIYAQDIYWEMTNKQYFDDQTFFYLSKQQLKIYVIGAISTILSQTCYYLCLHNIFYLWIPAYALTSDLKYLEQQAYLRRLKIFKILIKLFLLYIFVRFFVYFGYLLSMLTADDPVQQRHIMISVMTNSAIQLAILFIVYFLVFYFLLRDSSSLKKGFQPIDIFNILKAFKFLYVFFVVKMVVQGYQITEPYWKQIRYKDECDIVRDGTNGISIFLLLLYIVFGNIIPLLPVFMLLKYMEKQSNVSSNQIEQENREKLTENLYNNN